MPMVRPNKSLSVVIPAYNEEAYIEKCVTALETVLKDITDDFEIIVVNDGSEDRPAAILECLQRSRPYLVVAHHERNAGLGRTLRFGFARCRKEIAFYSDADLPFDFAELSRALRVMEFKNADVIPSQAVAQAIRQREYPLADRHPWQQCPPPRRPRRRSRRSSEGCSPAGRRVRRSRWAR